MEIVSSILGFMTVIIGFFSSMIKIKKPMKEPQKNIIVEGQVNISQSNVSDHSWQGNGNHNTFMDYSTHTTNNIQGKDTSSDDNWLTALLGAAVMLITSFFYLKFRIILQFLNILSCSALFVLLPNMPFKNTKKQLKLSAITSVFMIIVIIINIQQFWPTEVTSLLGQIDMNHFVNSIWAQLRANAFATLFLSFISICTVLITCFFFIEIFRLLLFKFHYKRQNSNLDKLEIKIYRHWDSCCMAIAMLITVLLFFYIYCRTAQQTSIL